MSKAVAFSDLHAHSWSDFSTIVDYRKEKMNSRLVDCLRVIDDVTAYVIKHHIKLVFFAGDLFHRKRLIDIIVFNAVSAALYRLARHVDALYVLAGNHDLVRRSASGVFSSEHALDSLNRYKRIHVVDAPTIIDGIGLVPYVDDHETVLRGLDAVDGARSLIMHAGISGAHTGVIEYRPLEPLKAEELPNVQVFSGHYHRPQSIERKGAGIDYIGAPLEFMRGDGHSKTRGFIVFDTNRPQEFERIKIKGPRFVTLNASDTTIRNEDVRGNFIDLMLDGDERDGLEAINLVKMYMDHGARAVETFTAPKAKQKLARLKVSTKGGALPSVGALCDAYAKRSPSDLDRDELRRIARLALEEAETT